MNKNIELLLAHILIVFLCITLAIEIHSYLSIAWILNAGLWMFNVYRDIRILKSQYTIKRIKDIQDKDESNDSLNIKGEDECNDIG